MPAQPKTAQTADRQPVSKLYSLQLLSYEGNALSKPYFNLYLVASGVTASTLGLLLSIGALLEMLVPPLLNTLADRYSWHRNLYIMFITCLMLSCMIMAGAGHTLALAAGLILSEAAFRPSITLGLQLVISRMNHEGRHIVGRVRSFSSFGFGIASLGAGRLFAFGGYPALFASAAIAYFGSLSLAGSLPPATTQQQTRQAKPRVPRTRGFYIIAISMFFMMMGQRTGYAFWFVHFQQNLGVSTEEMAIVIAVMALTEIPFFVLLDRVLLRVDLRIVFVAGSVGMALVWFAVGILPDRTWIFPLLIIRGAVFATLHLTTFYVIERVSDPGNVATNQSLAQGTIPSLAALITGSISGWIYEFIGAQVLFTLVMCACLTGTVLSLLAFRQQKKAGAAAGSG